MPGWCAGEHLSAGLFLQLFLMPVCCIGAAVVFIASDRLGTSTPGSVPSSAPALCLPTHPLASPEPQNMLPSPNSSCTAQLGSQATPSQCEGVVCRPFCMVR